MHGRLMVVALSASLTLPLAAWAHPDARGLDQGQVLNISATAIELKTDDEILKLMITDDTMFELNKKPVDRSRIRKGDWVGVFIVMTVRGEPMAGKIVLGIPKPPPAAKPKPKGQ